MTDQPTSPLAAEKSALRARLRAARRELSPPTLEAAATALAAHAPSLARPVVALFVSAGAEPPTLPLIDVLSELGVGVLLPVMQEDMDLDWAMYDGSDALVPGRRGILVPSGPALGLDAIAAAELVLVPALAVGRDGSRLGQGGGSYDRTLARARASIVAVVHDAEVLDSVPVEPHDQRIDGYLTPSEGVVLIDSNGLSG